MIKRVSASIFNYINRLTMLNGTLQYPVYKNGRLLTEKERNSILSKKIDDKSNIDHKYNFVKMNSTYIECVNNSFF